MYTVVNHLIFRDRVDPAVFASFSALADELRATDGFEAAHVVQTSEREVLLLFVGRDAESLDRIATEVGSPWMMRTVVPRLAGAPDRQFGPVIASTTYGAA